MISVLTEFLVEENNACQRHDSKMNVELAAE
jgi:hypothetical protein